MPYARVACDYALPKICKTFTVLPKFRPIVDTTSICCYNAACYLTKLLYLLTQNEFMIIDSFDAANKIKSVPPEVFDDGYVLASFDMKSLSTNVPLQRTIKIILDRVYDKKLIATQLKKRPLKRPI